MNIEKQKSSRVTHGIQNLRQTFDKINKNNNYKNEMEIPTTMETKDNISFLRTPNQQYSNNTVNNTPIAIDTSNTLRKSSVIKVQGRSSLEKLAQCIGFGDHPTDQEADRTLISYLHWTFRTSFTTLFLAFLVKFMILVLIFSGIIAFVIFFKPACITPPAERYSDYFGLSWTTFTTVGYGNNYPSLDKKCAIFSFVISMEAFIGVLFAGFSGAIIFGKVLRIQSLAQVIFSEPVLVRYGQGVNNNLRYSLDTDTPELDKIPCPVLEFRIVNRLYDRPGCEIIDAALTCMVLNTGSSPSSSPTSNNSNDSTYNMKESRPRHIDENLNDVDYCVHKLEIEMSQHAFFKRLWISRHIMNENSPVLTPSTRRLIRKNGGFWPMALNSYEGVQNSIEFDQIVVNLSGTSNISAANVYAQKIYTEIKLKIGFQFINIVYKHTDTGRIMLHMQGIHDVSEQDGGSGDGKDD